jgi:hypothetical protein
VCWSDRRKKWLELTAVGLAEFGRIANDTVASGNLDLAYECALGTPIDDDAWFYLHDSYGAVRLIARSFGDTASQPYPTGHPDD